MSLSLKNGQTSVVLRFKLLDSSSTVGAGLTGLTSASTGLIISTIADNESSATAYTVAGSTIQTITTLGTYAAPSASNVRFKEVDSTNHKGIYEFQIADARFAVSGAKSLLISVSGATSLVQADYLVPLVVDDPYVAKVTSGSGAGQISLSSGAVTVGTNNDKTGYTASTVSDKTGYSLAQSFPSNFASLGISAGGHISNVDTLTTYTGDTPQTGDVFARVGAAGAGLTALGDARIAHLDADVSSRMATFTLPTHFSVLAIDVSGGVTFNNTSIATVTNLTNAPTSGDLTSTMKASVTTAATAATPTAAGVTGLTVANLDVAVSTRLATSSYTAPDNSDITAIKAKTDNLPSDPSSESLIIAATNALGSSIAALPTTTTVNAIKTKTDNLPANPAAVGSAMTISGTITTLDELAAHGDANWESSVGAPTAVQIREEMDNNSTRLAAIETVTDALPTSIAALPTTSTVMPADIQKVNGVSVTGNGAGTPWGPA